MEEHVEPHGMSDGSEAERKQSEALKPHTLLSIPMPSLGIKTVSICLLARDYK